MRLLIILLTILGTLNAYSQKDELKTIQKAYKKGEFKKAASQIKKYKSLFKSASQKEQDKYIFLKAQTYYELAKSDISNSENVKMAAIALKEAPNKKQSDVNTINTMRNDLSQKLHAYTIKSYEAKDMKTAMNGFYNLYKIKPQDTVYLYSAASLALSDKSTYNNALEHYKELLDLNYDGSSITYLATNKSSGKEESFGTSKSARDLNIKLGTHENPRNEQEPSKKPEIIKNIALILTSQGKKEEALKAIDEAIKNNPEDYVLVTSKADLYYQMGDLEKYEKTMQKAIKIDPNNPDLFYNIGVTKSNAKQYKDAIEYYQKALDIKKDYMNAVLNMSTAYLEQGNKLVAEMNDLSDTKKNKKVDWKKYDSLKQKKENYFKKGAEVLETYLKNNPKEKGILGQLKNIYGALGDNENFLKIKKMMD